MHLSVAAAVTSREGPRARTKKTDSGMVVASGCTDRGFIPADVLRCQIEQAPLPGALISSTAGSAILASGRVKLTNHPEAARGADNG